MTWGYRYGSVPAAAQLGVTAVAAGATHALALVAPSGRVVAWQRWEDADGGTRTNHSAMPAEAAAGGVVAIAAGGDHSLALLGAGARNASAASGGRVLAWGNGTWGQTAVPAEAARGALAIAAGWAHSLALVEGGRVVAWGDGAHGATRVPPDAQADVTAIAAGGGHSLALRSDGRVVAWGANSMTQSDVPASVQRAVAVAAGRRFSLALLAGSGRVVAWGANDAGQTDVPPDAQAGVVAIAAGADHALAVLGDGRVVAWGATSAPAFGAAAVPLALATAANNGTQRAVAVAVAAGDASSLALVAVEPGRVIAWGRHFSPVPEAARSGVAAVSAGATHAVALLANRSVVAWRTFGEYAYDFNWTVVAAGSPLDWARDAATVPPEALADVVAVAAGFDMSLALLASGRVVAWGNRTFGQLDVPDAAQSDVVAIAAGLGHSLALLGRGGRVVAWGNNTHGQVEVPAVVQATGGAVAIAGGAAHSLAVLSDGGGRVVAWGLNDCGQTDVPPEALSGVIAVAAGRCHSLALLGATGRVVAWGSNADGQTTVPEAAQSKVVAISAGFFASAALLANGSVVTWGDLGSWIHPWARKGAAAISLGLDQGLALVAPLPSDLPRVAPPPRAPPGRLVAWGTRVLPWPDEARADVVECQDGVVLQADGSIVMTTAEWFTPAWFTPALWRLTPDPNSRTVAIARVFRDTILALTEHGLVLRIRRVLRDADPPVAMHDVIGVPQSVVVAIAGGCSGSCGDLHALALLSSGRVVGWGGMGVEDVPEAATSGVTAIAAGGNHALALLSTGAVVAWGDNTSGQADVPEAARSGVVAIAAGANHSLALLSTGTHALHAACVRVRWRRRCHRVIAGSDGVRRRGGGVGEELVREHSEPHQRDLVRRHRCRCGPLSVAAVQRNGDWVGWAPCVVFAPGCGRGGGPRHLGGAWPTLRHRPPAAGEPAGCGAAATRS